MKNILMEYLKENNFNIKVDNSLGIIIKCFDDELLIKGSQYDLIELAEYILNVALSSNEKDHIHLDNLSLINSTSSINNLIIEKE